MTSSLLKKYYGLTALLGLLVCPHALATELVGAWVLDVERTAQVQPEQPQQRQWFKGQNVSTSVSYGGMPLPRVRHKVPPQSTLSEREPSVLRCKEMTIAHKGDDLLFTYLDVGSEVRKKGKHRGFKTSWNNKTLNESYRSTTRKVTHKFEMQKDESLLVTVVIKPDKGPKRIFKQIFNRKNLVKNLGEAGCPRTDRSQSTPLDTPEQRVHKLSIVSLAVLLTAAIPASAEYTIQVGAFSKPSQAFADQLRELGEVNTAQNGRGMTVFTVGRYESASAAKADVERVRLRYADAFVRAMPEAARSASVAMTTPAPRQPQAASPARSRLVSGTSQNSELWDGLTDEERRRVVYLDGVLHLKQGESFVPLAEYRRQSGNP